MTAADDLPPLPGAYAVDILLPHPVPLPPRFAQGRDAILPAGRYLYLGSAYGPGGIRARCRRHLATAKTLRWHVDWLTSQAERVAVLVFAGGTECDLVARVLAAGATAPVAGFGSSDCQVCTSHLLRWPPAVVDWPETADTQP